MGKRLTPMPDYYVRRVILAEFKRATAAGRPIDRDHLRNETGVAAHELDRRIAAVRFNLDELESAAANPRRPVGGAKPGPGPSPTGTDPDPFAPPTTTGRERQWKGNSKP